MGVPVRGPTGDITEVDPSELAAAHDRGYVPISDEEQAGSIATAPNVGHGGIVGGLNALATSAASGLTLGGSDWLLRALTSKNAMESLRQDRANHPILSATGQIAGGIAPMVAAPESLLGYSPAGYLSRLAGEGVEASRAAGGLKALAGVAAISGGEAAAQNAGMYLSDIALGNRDLTVEGMAGALGRGFAFGSVAGGATYGLEQGTIAARRMFATTAEGGKDAAKLAGDTFQRKADELLQAHDDTVQAAQNQLDQIRQARAQLQATKASADTEIARARLDLANQPTPVETPAPVEAPAGAPAPAKPRIPTTRGYSPTSVGPASSESGTLTQAEIATTGKAPAVETGAPAPAAAQPETPSPVQLPQTSALEDQLGAMKASIDQGATLQDMNPFSGMSEDQLATKETQLQSAINDAAARRAKVNDWIARIKNPRISYDVDAIAPEAIGEGQMPMIRGRRTEALPEDVMVEQSGGNIRTIGQGEHTLEDITPNSRILARSNGDDFAAGQKLDEAYQDAIERASAAGNAAEREAALREAADIEQQIHQYVRAMKPQNADVIDQIERVRAQQGRTGYHAAFARAERLSERESELVPATLGKAEPESETTYLNALRAKDNEPINLAWYGVKPGSVEDIDEAANVLGPYEKSVTQLSDAVGPDASPVAQQHAADFHAAEDNAERKVMDRTARAVDDHVQTVGTPDEMPPTTIKPTPERYGPGEQFGPNMPESVGARRGTPQERIEGAKAVKLEANAKLAKLREDEMGAKGELQKALDAQKSARKAAATISPGKVKVVPHAGGILSKLEKAGEILEVAHMAGLHGLPNPEDIPVIGPLLGWYLKWRALGRVWGRIPASGEARAAALAASTRNRAALAVDRMLGLAAKAAPIARDVAVRAGGRAAEALSERIFDDGQPDAPKGASIQQQAAVRIREIAAAAANPDQVTNKIRMQMRGVTDPDLIAAAEQMRLRQIAYLNQIAPQAPIPTPLGTKAWTPSVADSMRLGRVLAVLDDPNYALEQIQSKTITPDAAAAYQNFYPNSFAEVQQRLLQQSIKVNATVPFDQRSRMGLLFNVPLDRLAEPETIAALHISAPGSNSPAANPTQNQPAMGHPVQLASLYETAADRRAARR